jgi:hypothetical protein
MLESQREQEERRRTLQNDVRVKEQTGTFLSHTHDDIHQGRFAAIGPAVVVGADPVPNDPPQPRINVIQYLQKIHLAIASTQCPNLSLLLHSRLKQPARH